jgi:hypothetical protein
LPDRHPVRDFFVADILEWALKDDRASMEHPFFNLSKTRDTRTRRYEHNGVKVIMLCSIHADQVAQREKLKGREIVRRG